MQRFAVDMIPTAAVRLEALEEAVSTETSPLDCPCRPSRTAVASLVGGFAPFGCSLHRAKADPPGTPLAAYPFAPGVVTTTYDGMSRLLLEAGIDPFNRKATRRRFLRDFATAHDMHAGGVGDEDTASETAWSGGTSLVPVPLRA